MNYFRLLCITLIFETILITQAINVSDHLKKQAKKLQNLCEKETGVTKELLGAAAKGEIQNERTIECFLHCMFDKVGLIDSDNIMHLEYLLDILPEEFHDIINDLVSQCGTQSGADGCETSYLTVQCYKAANPVIFEQVLTFLYT